jgi:hypothetical protein
MIRLILISGWGMYGMTACHASGRPAAENGVPQTPCGFTIPAIPDSITEIPGRANFLVSRYWENFDFTDTACIHLPEITEQAFADYLNILPLAAAAETGQSIRRLLAAAEAEKSGRMYGYFLQLFDKYLYDPNSPYRDDELYIPVAQYILADARSGEADKIRMQYTLKLMLKNRKGETAADFTYVRADGKEGRMHDVKAGYTILMFYNPDCHACGKNITAMKESALITKLHKAGTVAILLFYPDEDVAVWKQHLPDIPADWINGYDRHVKVKDGEIYDLRAIPSLYLLDRDKKVLLKDVDYEQLEKWLTEQFQYLSVL